MRTSADHTNSAAPSSRVEDTALLIGRILLAAMLLIAAWNKSMAFPAMVGYFGKLGLPMPAITLPVVLAFESLSGLALIAGFQTRIVALLVGLFCISAGLVAHTNIADINQFNHLIKNMGLLGGCLALYVAGPGRWSIDGR